jgi:hypothetical protein
MVFQPVNLSISCVGKDVNIYQYFAIPWAGKDVNIYQYLGRARMPTPQDWGIYLLEVSTLAGKRAALYQILEGVINKILSLIRPISQGINSLS